MAGNRFAFSTLMTLADYENKLGKESGTSPDQPVGETYGSFLGAYLSYRLMNAPEGQAFEVLMANQAKIQALVNHKNCKITFETSTQLPYFFTFLTTHVDVWHALVEAGFLKVDAVCDDRNTFLNTYFSQKPIKEEKEADEAIKLLNSAKACLTIPNKHGVIPLGAFISQFKNTDELASNNAILWKWEALSDAFALSNHEVGVSVKPLVKACVDFYNAHHSHRFAINFLYRLLTVAANYGVSVHEPLPELGNDSFIKKMVCSDMALHWPAATLREYYRSLNKDSQGMKVKVGRGLVHSAAPIVWEANTGAITGLVRIEGALGERSNQLRIFPQKDPNNPANTYVFDIFKLSQFIDISVFRAESGQLKLGVFEVDRSTRKDAVCNFTRVVTGVFNQGITFSSIREEWRCGLPTQYRNSDVKLFVSIRLGYSEYNKLNLSILIKGSFDRYVGINDRDGLKDSHVKAFKEKYKDALQSFESNYMDNLRWAIENPDNYHLASQYYSQVTYAPKAEYEMNLLEYYLRHGGFGEEGDPRDLYQFQVKFKSASEFHHKLVTGPIAACNHDARRDVWEYLTPDQREGRARWPLSYELPINIDLEILRHFQKIGYDFNTGFVEEVITDLLKNGNLTDPTLYHLMCCFAECGARFPKNIDDQLLAAYLQGKLQAIKPEDRINAYRQHLTQVIELCRKENALDQADSIRSYLAEFGVEIPAELETVDAISGFLLSDEGLRLIVTTIDLHYPKVNEARINVKADALQFKRSIKDNNGNAALAWVGLRHYVESGEYSNLDRTKEEAYFQLYFDVIRKSCKAFQFALAQAMNVNAMTAGKPSLWGVAKTMKRIAKMTALGGDVTSSVGQKLNAILRFSPGDADGRKQLLTLVGDLLAFVRAQRPSDKKAAKEKVPSRTVREVFDQFLKAGCLPENIDVTHEMTEALKTLVQTRRPSDDSSSLSDYVTPTGTPADSDDEDEDVKALIQATAPPSATVDDEPPLQQPRSTQVKAFTMFGGESFIERDTFTARTTEYKAFINSLIYPIKSGGPLAEMINGINEAIEKGSAVEPSLAHVICPLTKKVSFYPCGLGDTLAYFDLDNLGLTQWGSEIDGVTVNESTIQFLNMREMMSFMAVVKVLHQSLGLSLEDAPKPNRPS